MESNIRPPQVSTLFMSIIVRVSHFFALTKRWLVRMFPICANWLIEIGPHSGTSPLFGKAETIAFIEGEIPDRNATFLDVGPGRGIYSRMLRQQGYLRVDAVEIYRPYIEAFGLSQLYGMVHAGDICNFDYEWYDVVIFGDILEHLNILDASRVIDFARSHSRLIIVAVPYLCPQIGSQLDGSGDHRQDDLSRNVFLDRYPGFSLLLDDDKTGIFFSRASATPPSL